MITVLCFAVPAHTNIHLSNIKQRILIQSFLVYITKKQLGLDLLCLYAVENVELKVY